MCTLTFVPSSKITGDFILTSNRDEAPDRKTIPPEIYTENNVELCYPKDNVSGGTWIGASSQKRLACLLNGGFSKHNRLKQYRKSRGLIVKELLIAKETLSFLKNINLLEIEPFTIISIDWQNALELYQFVWDGTKKHLQKIPVSPQIWSASMLYSEEVKQNREKLFNEFLKEKRHEFKSDALIEFQKKFIIDRKVVKTTSITQFVHSKKSSKMIYNDLLTAKTESVKMQWR